jgi:hypothetical protein
MVKIGDRIKILNRDGQYGKWANKLWTVDHIATSREEHRGYDEGIGGKLVSAKGLPVSLYEWEIEVVPKSNKLKRVI